MAQNYPRPGESTTSTKQRKAGKSHNVQVLPPANSARRTQDAAAWPDLAQLVNQALANYHTSVANEERREEYAAAVALMQLRYGRR